jgi:hypothetical protein
MHSSQNYAEKFKPYENKWVALAGPEEQVVGCGNDAVEALADAEKHGYTDTVLYKVFPLNAYYIPVHHAV